MSSSLYDSKTYSSIDLNTVNFTESQVKNEKFLKTGVFSKTQKRAFNLI